MLSPLTSAVSPRGCGSGGDALVPRFMPGLPMLSQREGRRVRFSPPLAQGLAEPQVPGFVLAVSVQTLGPGPPPSRAGDRRSSPFGLK